MYWLFERVTAVPTKEFSRGAAGAICLGIIMLLSPPEAQAQRRVCQVGDIACLRELMAEMRAVTRERERRKWNEGASLPQRYYGGGSVRPLYRTQRGNCDVKPVISGSATRVVRTCR